MKYSLENTSLKYLDLAFSELLSGEIRDGTLIFCLGECFALKNAPENTSGKKCRIPRLTLTLSDFCIKSALLHGVPYINPKDNSLKRNKDRQLYKSELDPLSKRLCGGGDIDIFSFEVSENGGIAALAEINIEDDERAWYRIEFACSRICAEWEEFGEAVREKISLKHKAAMLKEYIPAVFLALGHKDTPMTARIAAAAALGYALSPLDLIPDFIPVLGYLDDVLILSGLIALAVKLIPRAVMTECLKKAAENRIMPRKQWYYALPVMIIWLILLGLIVNAVI